MEELAASAAAARTSAVGHCVISVVCVMRCLRCLRFLVRTRFCEFRLCAEMIIASVAVSLLCWSVQVATTATTATTVPRSRPAVEAVSAHGICYVAVLCCAVLCCAVLCCAVLCCAVLCCAVLCCAVLCCAVLCCAVAGGSLNDGCSRCRRRSVTIRVPCGECRAAVLVTVHVCVHRHM
jgi:hypothetical protein